MENCYPICACVTFLDIYKIPRECFVIDIGPVLMGLSRMWRDRLSREHFPEALLARVSLIRQFAHSSRVVRMYKASISNACCIS